MNEPPQTHQEIIIVRRSNGGGDGGHHGGAWKIAYADFVTAMMAFFLVMWLINSANEVTKSRVASYFNPIKMTDAAPSGRGLKNITEKKATHDAGDLDNAGEQKPEKQKEEKSASQVNGEDELMRSPFSKIEEIAAKSEKVQEPVSGQVIDRGSGDPFDPQAWRIPRNGKLQGESNAETDSAEKNPIQSDRLLPDGAESAQTALSEDPPAKPPGVEQSGKEANPLASKEVEALETAVKSIIKRHESEVDITATARRTDEGLLIVLGDNSGRGMFDIGSAKPSAALIDIVGVIGKLLSERPGEIVVRGHTDDRKFRSSRFDNWQLSTARAHMASYMLIRGGLAESRIKRIEGYGAASPLLKSDPSADSNRRVEFLLVDNSKAP